QATGVAKAPFVDADLDLAVLEGGEGLFVLLPIFPFQADAVWRAPAGFHRRLIHILRQDLGLGEVVAMRIAIAMLRDQVEIAGAFLDQAIGPVARRTEFHLRRLSYDL